MKVLLTNDDGIQATGLNAMRRALLKVPDIELAVIAPDSNRSATARSITTREPLWVEELEFEDGTTGFATDGTPVDCVRFAALGLVEFQPELIVSGINHGSNLGDDITYSGTVAAALEGMVLGVPAIAVSQQSALREMDFRLGQNFDFDVAAAFVARLVEELDDLPMPPGTLLNVNVPAGEVKGARACRCAAPLSHLRRGAGLPPRGGHGLRRDGGRLHRRHAAALRPDRHRGSRGALGLRPRPPPGARRARG
jgi:5'-nucleotidase